MSEWVLHCEVNQRHMRRSHPTKDAALKDACSQLLQGHAVNRIVGPNEQSTSKSSSKSSSLHSPEERKTEARLRISEDILFAPRQK
jgi:hypothetical protein